MMLLENLALELEAALMLRVKLEYLKEEKDSSDIQELFIELDSILKKEAVTDTIETMQIFLKENKKFIEYLHSSTLRESYGN